MEEDKLELAKSLEAKAKEKGVEFLLPTDVVLADQFDKDAESQIVKVENIPDGWMGLDVARNMYLDYITTQSIKFYNKGCEKLPGDPFNAHGPRYPVHSLRNFTGS